LGRRRAGDGRLAARHRSLGGSRRDHADASLIARALEAGAPVLRPPAARGDEIENLALAQAEAELAAHELRCVELGPWRSVQAGPFSVTALPAADGLGDPQLSWLVDDGDHRVLHCGDTLFHGYWWRIALRLGPIDLAFLPINGPVVDFPHRRPASLLPAAMTPEQAAVAGELLRARAVAPMHYAGYDVEPHYRSAARAAERFGEAGAGRPFAVRQLQVGEETSVAW